MGEQIGAGSRSGGGKTIFIIIGVVIIVALAVLFFLYRPSLAGAVKIGSGSLPSFTQKKEPAGYSVLFKNLDYTEAALIVDSLKTQGVKDYRLEDDGRTILVPTKKRTDIVLTIAQEGIMPNGGAVGFEIFDKGSALGASEFDQNVKFSRAISGEMARSVARINGIEEARVIVVIPAKQLFSTVQNPVQASVMVKIVEGELLSPSQVQAIIALVSASVEGLQKENITVVDYHGRVLSSEEYAKDYDRLAALLAMQKAQSGGRNVSTAALMDSTEIPLEASEKADESSIFEMYYNIDNNKMNRQQRSSVRGLRLDANASAEEAYAAKMKFKERYENLLERNVKQMANQFFPKKATTVKVNVELNDRPFDAVTPNSMIARITSMILLDQNNKDVVLTPEVREAFMKSIAAATSYVKGRDRIDLRWSPNTNEHNKGNLFSGLSSGQDKKTEKTAPKVTPVPPAPQTGKDQPVIDLSKLQSKPEVFWTWNNILYLGCGLFGVLLLIIVLRPRHARRVTAEKGGKKSSVFDEPPEDKEGFADLAAPSTDAIRELAAQSPDKVAAVLEKWFQEDAAAQK
ncbi:flagellar M-ring protein [Candidatus Termititenax aidoneus]|uniref:Flagellar M-ring protein n=1 Tax=Termititenax aidoneus TaxID=2218524 RepID=A0A388TBR3_TERA1|nr:flagellar M-ring protein [Candidatus Termititenax aidoneus]